ncbi:MAG: hypothetical protein Kow0068_20190 [Marinilabiliales bacterium]
MKQSVFFLLITISIISFAQPVPTEEENIPYLVTFGKQGDISWGDDDFCQVFFFRIPKDYKNPLYIRVYDPDCGGAIDEEKTGFNTKTRFSVYGGKSCYSDPDARKTNPVGNYKSGNLLASKIFDSKPDYDQKWYTFGPFNPSEGEYIDKYEGYIFKVIAEGITGDDGNLYKYYLSTQADNNKPIEGGNSFTYEYTFRLYDDAKNVSHIYPYIDENVISIKQSNFDWDDDGEIRILSVTKNCIKSKTSGDSNWAHAVHKIDDEEHNTSLDIQFRKNPFKPVKNNNVVVYITNQYGELLPFYTTPIGGIPEYKYSIGVKPQNK